MFEICIVELAKEKYRGVFETQKYGDKTSSREIGLDIRTHASPGVGQDQVSGGVNALKHQNRMAERSMVHEIPVIVFQILPFEFTLIPMKSLQFVPGYKVLYFAYLKSEGTIFKNIVIIIRFNILDEIWH